MVSCIFFDHFRCAASTGQRRWRCELLIGRVAKSELEKLPYGNWRLSDAPEPILLDDAGSGMTPGAISPLVGTDAPDFALDTLDEQHFILSDHAGQVVVLDFWATWCGPCLQAMPMIAETVSAFDRADVLLVAVNLQETADPIRQTLERLKIQPTVALDIDGVVG